MKPIKQISCGIITGKITFSWRKVTRHGRKVSHTILSHSQNISMEFAKFQKTLKIPHHSGITFISMLFQMSVVSVQSPDRGQMTGRLSQELLQEWLRTTCGRERFLSHRCDLRFICNYCNKCIISFLFKQ